MANSKYVIRKAIHSGSTLINSCAALFGPFEYDQATKGLKKLADAEALISVNEVYSEPSYINSLNTQTRLATEYTLEPLFTLLDVS